MKKSITKLLVLTLTTVVITATLSGCKEKEPKKDDPANGKPQTVKFVYAQQDRKATLPGDQEVLKFINEKFNVDYQRIDIPPEQVKEKFSVMLASGEQIDAIPVLLNNATDPRDLEKLRTSNTIQPLNDLLNKHGKTLLKEIPQDCWAYVTDKDGKIWAIPEMGFKSKAFLFIREDWMKKLNLTAPKTIDEFEKMLIAFRDADFDGNGKKDTYPLINNSYMDYGFMGSFLPNGNSWFEDKDGNLVPPFMHENYKLYMSTLQKWYKEKLIHPENLTLKSEQVKDFIVKGVSGVFPNWYTLSYEDDVAKVDANGKIGYIPFPVGPSGKSGAMSDGIVRGGLAISAKTKPEVAERIIQIMDWFQTPEGTNLQWYGIEGKHWAKDGDKIKLAPGIDKQAYNAQLYINGGNSWKYFTETTFARPPLTGITRQQAIHGKYPSIDAADYLFPYDFNKMKSKDSIADLDKMQQQMYFEVVTGAKPVSYIDEFIKTWKSKGGELHIKEKTEQYKELKKTYGAKK